MHSKYKIINSALVYWNCIYQCVCVCVCVCVYLYRCMYIYPSITSAYMYTYQRVRLRSSHAGLQWHVGCWRHAILVYRFNKQDSHVLLSIQFDTNVSQLLRHVLPWSRDPLPSLGELSSSRLNRLSVCQSCLFWLCIAPAVYGRHKLCLRGLRVALFSEKKGFFFLFFPQKKWTPSIKKNKKNSSRHPWRQSDVSCHTSAPPHLTTDVSPWQLNSLKVH